MLLFPSCPQISPAVRLRNSGGRIENRRFCGAFRVRTIADYATGGSTLLLRMILADIEQGHGVVVLDPHGDLVSKLLDRISRQHADRVIYLDPGDPDHVPMWNPLTPPPTKVMDRGRAADDIVSGFKKFIEGWGDRLEHLLRHAVDGVMCLPGGSLLDVSNVLRQYSPERQSPARPDQETTDSEISRRFWSEDFPRYTKVDLVPPQHKLSKLLGSGPVSLMLSQPDSAFQFRDIMDEGRILLVNLANLGSETRNVLGCFMLSSLYHAALSRSSLPEEQRRPFHAYCDESHRFATNALGDVIAECRKFCVGMTLAHQHLNQLTARDRCTVRRRLDDHAQPHWRRCRETCRTSCAARPQTKT